MNEGEPSQIDDEQLARDQRAEDSLMANNAMFWLFFILVIIGSFIASWWVNTTYKDEPAMVTFILGLIMLIALGIVAIREFYHLFDDPIAQAEDWVKKDCLSPDSSAFVYLTYYFIYSFGIIGLFLLFNYLIIRSPDILPIYNKTGYERTLLSIFAMLVLISVPAGSIGWYGYHAGDPECDSSPIDPVPTFRMRIAWAMGIYAPWIFLSIYLGFVYMEFFGKK